MVMLLNYGFSVLVVLKVVWLEVVVSVCVFLVMFIRWVCSIVVSVFIVFIVMIIGKMFYIECVVSG